MSTTSSIPDPAGSNSGMWNGKKGSYDGRGPLQAAGVLAGMVQPLARSSAIPRPNARKTLNPVDDDSCTVVCAIPFASVNIGAVGAVPSTVAPSLGGVTAAQRTRAF